jgi:bifunctional DNA-binding transcriptional regulator/antitoxin component of YhaV-PrlF toxin-antitoxin module
MISEVSSSLVLLIAWNPLHANTFFSSSGQVSGRPGIRRLTKGLQMWHLIPMNATLSLDEAGRLVLPINALRLFGMKPGDQVRADVSPNRIDICPEPPVVSEGVIESGVLVMARQGIPMDAAAAVRADRDALAERSLPR